MAADWSERGGYIFAQHQVTPAQANEALADPNRAVFDPDYNSETRRGVRTIGYSPTAAAVVTVITVEDEGTVYGATAFKANSRDRRYYKQGGPDEQIP